MAHVFDTPVAIGASARPAIRRTLPFSDSTAAGEQQSKISVAPSSPSSPRGPGSYRSMHPTVTPAGTTAPDVYDDRTRHACVTRGEGSCVPTELAREEPVLDTSSSAFFSLVARAELSVTRGALSHSQCQVESGLARVGIDEKIYSFLVLFWQRVQPRVDGWRRAQPVGCDGIRHSRVISSCTNTLLPLRVCPASMYTRRASCPAGLGSASDSSDDSTRVSTRLFFQSAFE